MKSLFVLLTIAIVCCFAHGDHSHGHGGGGHDHGHGNGIEKEVEIYIAPGPKKTETIEAHGHTCSFTYNVVGGTGENWKFAITHQGADIACAVTRANKGPTYLVWLDWSLKGNGFVVQDVVVEDGSAKPMPKNTHYTWNGDIVAKGSATSNGLSAVVLQGTSSKKEL